MIVRQLATRCASRIPIAVAALGLWACDPGPEPTAGPPSESARPYVTGPFDFRTGDLEAFGRDLDQAVEVTDRIYQARGTANAQMVVTPEGRVLIDTGLPTEVDRFIEQLEAVDDGPITHIVATHAHGDHYGATDSWAQEGTAIIAHAEFPHNQTYLKALSPLLMPRNKIFFPEDTPDIPRFARKAVRLLYPTIEPTILVHDRYDFEVGGVRFEVLAMPGAEGSDGLAVWLPDEKVLFTGDLFGHIFPMWPNLTTIRGERTRMVMPYLDTLDRILELEPEMLVPSHFYPILGKDYIRETVTKIRDAVAYVHDAVIEGMNDEKDVYTLMNEIRLPEELAIPEVHGKVSWGVRSIWDAYLGWFHLRSSAELYPVPPYAVHAEVVEMAGGADAIAERAAAKVAEGRPVEALHLVDMALAADPDNAAALRVRLSALEELLERSGGINHYEVRWLEHRIGETRRQLELPGA